MGTVSDVAGSLSDTMSRKTTNDNSTVIPSDTFSPLSGGNQNTSSPTSVISIHGITRLNM